MSTILTPLLRNELAQAARQDVVVVIDVAEGLLRGEEMHFGAAPLARAGRLERRHRRPLRNSIWCTWPSRQIVSRSHSDSAFTTETPTPCSHRDLVAVGVELAAGVQRSSRSRPPSA